MVLLLIVIVLFSSVSTAGAFRKGVESKSEVFLVAVVVACDCVEGKGVELGVVGRQGEEKGVL